MQRMVARMFVFVKPVFVWFVGMMVVLGLLVSCGDPGIPVSCKTDSDCPAHTKKCDKQICVVVVEQPCTSDAACGPSKVCTNGICKPGGCEDKSTRPCYDGPTDTAGKGLCKAGTQTCKDGIWDICQGQVLPALETCNGKDDNCDGRVDEGMNCTCQANAKEECYNGPPDTKGVGVCLAGTRYCSTDGRWGECLRESLPHAEVCDGKDNDCNGVIDETFPGKGDPCPTGKFGACSQGAKICQDGKIVCGEAYKPAPEVCDNIDNDCDGQIDEDGVCAACDEGKEQNCYTGPQGTEGKGICKAGRTKCVNGAWSPCLGEVKPEAEKCDDKVDNNCNGQIDEGCVLCNQGEQRPCYTGKSGCVLLADQKYSCFAPCQTGTQTCLGGQWGACQGEVHPKPEVCDGIDNDCNGSIDEGCSCRTGEQRFCYGGPSQTRGVGECKAGVQTCDSNGKWSACQGEVQPQAEQCNGKDDDCDGNIDGFSRVCYDGPPGSEKRGECRAGVQGCKNGQWTPCQGEIKPQAEQCNGLDDDCDGAIDGFSRPCFGGDKGCTTDGKGGYSCSGICSSGFQQCANGRWSLCVGEVLAKPETCNGLDDDCDGKVDGFAEDCYNSTDTGCTQNSSGAYTCKGECKTGKRTCTFGQWGSCSGDVIASTEQCDGKDNDCDGQIDNIQRKCWTGQTNNRNQGVCQDGLESCVNGQWSACQNQVLPTPEVCNGKDDDCDGSIDEDLTPPPCDLQQGVCAQKVKTCGGSQGWLACGAKEYGPDYETQETRCDGKDNDCNGKVDGDTVCGTCFSTTQAATFTASLPVSCSSQEKCFEHCLNFQGKLYYCRNLNNKGFQYITYEDWSAACTNATTCDTSQCENESSFCTGSSWRVGTKPGTNDDICDGIDNNCNGTVDEDCTCGSPCLADQYCKTGCSQCIQQAGKPTKTCVP